MRGVSDTVDLLAAAYNEAMGLTKDVVVLADGTAGILLTVCGDVA